MNFYEMKRFLALSLLFVLILIPFWGISQGFDFKKKTIVLNEIDTTNHIEFITRNAKIIIEKSDYLKRLNEEDEFYANYIDSINAYKNPSICLVANNHLLESNCRGSLNLQFVRDNALIIPCDIAKIILAGKALIIIISNNYKVKKLKVKKKSSKETLGSTYLVFVDPKSKKEILSLILSMGE